MKTEGLDALLMPLSAFGIPSYDAYDMNTWTIPLSSNSGLPAITAIAGFFKGLPVGVEFIGKMYGEKELIEMAYAYERIQPRQPPLMPAPQALPLKQYTISALNNLFTAIGYRSFMELSAKGVNDVNPVNFNPIVKEAIQDSSTFSR
ncbi:MAG: hypothetical protein LW832_09740 [Parachlamydia sp.]|jgi:hypothetical protein|nr:hypothetical protein [Parachlamydia sp.]